MNRIKKKVSCHHLTGFSLISTKNSYIKLKFLFFLPFSVAFFFYFLKRCRGKNRKKKWENEEDIMWEMWESWKFPRLNFSMVLLENWPSRSEFSIFPTKNIYPHTKVVKIQNSRISHNSHQFFSNSNYSSHIKFMKN